MQNFLLRWHFCASKNRLFLSYVMSQLSSKEGMRPICCNLPCCLQPQYCKLTTGINEFFHTNLPRQMNYSYLVRIIYFLSPGFELRSLDSQANSDHMSHPCVSSPRNWCKPVLYHFNPSNSMTGLMLANKYLLLIWLLKRDNTSNLYANLMYSQPLSTSGCF